MNEAAKDETFLPLKPVEFLVLMVLLEGELHGYGIVGRIAEQSDDRVRLMPGNLYGVLRRLIERGWIEESDRLDGDDLHHRRRYYRICPPGRQAAASEAARLRRLVRKAEAHRLLEKEEAAQ